MIDSIARPPASGPDELGALLTQKGELSPSEPEKADSTPAEKAPSTALPVAPDASFPVVLEAFAYRYQLDLSMAFSFAQDSGAPDPPVPPPPAPLEIIPINRGPQQGSRRQIVAGAFRELRAFHARAFVRQAQDFAHHFSPPTAENVQRSSRQVARTYTMDFSLDISFLQQFAHQSGTLSEYGESSFNAYLDISRTLSAHSGGEAAAFFDEVDALLADAEAHLQEEIPAFLQEVGAQLHLSEEDMDALEEVLSTHVAEFFATASEFLGEAEEHFRALSGPATAEQAALLTA